MDLKALKEIPSWNWPKDAEVAFREVLLDNDADPSDRCVAAELAGDYAVINDELSRVLLSILTSADQSESLRASAAIALGPALENADTVGFDDPDEELISKEVFNDVKSTFREIYEDLEAFWFEDETPAGGRIGHLHLDAHKAAGHAVAHLPLPEDFPQ